jgi:CubicO group peptidase (beta-lactamase class C family)
VTTAFVRSRLAVAGAALCVATGLAQAQERLDAVLEPVRQQHQLPALAAAVVVEGRIVAAGAVGTRRAGVAAPVTVDDRFHLGSDTKAMTALLAAQLVEQGRLRWNSTLGEVFPELAGRMDRALAKVTLEQLLSHSGGLPGDTDAFVAAVTRAMQADGNLDRMRYALLRDWCVQPLAAPAGTRFIYSNLGYTLVGAMLERTTGSTWDELIVQRVYGPLGLATAGLGPQATLGRVDAPLGHLRVDGALQAMLAGPNGDNPAVIGPAGLAHMSILDFARWAGWQAGEGRRGLALVSAATLRKMHTPVIDIPASGGPGRPRAGRYALGWGQVEVAWAAQPLLQHTGSNGMNLAQIWLDPQRDAAIVLTTNVGDDGADAALHGLAETLYRRYVAR